MTAIVVVINCKSRKDIHPDLFNSLNSQNEPFQLEILESNQAPVRLSNIRDPEAIYLFLDQDVVLPHEDYLKQLKHQFNDSPDKLFFTGAYLNSSKLTYLGRCYNFLVNAWISSKYLHKKVDLCMNAPGGIWAISGKILPRLSGWIEPSFWAGEDTYSIRWLQARGVNIYYSPKADLLHFPISNLAYYIQRAYKQGYARSQFNLSTKSWHLNWKYRLINLIYWPGWLLHQFFVTLGSIRSLMASPKP